MSTAKTTDKKAAWKAAKRHKAILPSGFEVEIELPNLAQMVKTGQIPNNLIDAAVRVATGDVPDKVTPELLAEQAEFYNKLVVLAVKDPEITEEDVEDLPYEDLEMIVEIATRQRDMDAAYRHLGGLEKVESFRAFRGIPDFESDVEGV